MQHHGPLAAYPESTAALLSPKGDLLVFVSKGDMGTRSLNIVETPSFALRHSLSLPLEGRYGGARWASDGRWILVEWLTGDDEGRLLVFDSEEGTEHEYAGVAGHHWWMVAAGWEGSLAPISVCTERGRYEVWTIDLATRERIWVFENEELYMNVTLASPIRIAAAQIRHPDTSSDLVLFDPSGREATRIPFCPAEEKGWLICANENHVYYSGTEGLETLGLWRLCRATGRRELLFSDPKHDLEWNKQILDPVTHVPLAVAIHRSKREWHFIEEPEGHPAHATFRERGPVFHELTKPLGEVDLHIVSHTTDLSQFVVRTLAPDGSSGCHLANLATGQLTVLKARVCSAPPHFHIHELTLTASDGLPLPSYLALPAERQRPPLVLLPHGGPQSRDTLFNYFQSWLTKRGFAVLRVNFRGSTGFGKRHEALLRREWGGAVIRDLHDATLAVTERFDLGPVCAMGYSFGGFAALMAHALYPETFKAAISISSPIDLATMMHGIPPHWEHARAVQRRFIGDPEREPEFLASQSPFGNVHRIRGPVLLGHGTRDVTFPFAKTEEFAKILEERGIPVEFLRLDGESHGVVSRSSKEETEARIESFLFRWREQEAREKGTVFRNAETENASNDQRMN